MWLRILILASWRESKAWFSATVHLAVKISNADPTMLALCPLHLTLTQKAKRVTVLFVRPGVIAQSSKAEASAKELEDKVIKAIESGLSDGQ